MTREDGLARLGMLLTGVMCWWGATTAFEGGNPAQYAETHALVLVGFLWGFVLFGAAAVGVASRVASGLAAVGATLVFLDHAAVNAEVARFVGIPATTDVRVYMDYAAWLLLEGKNPYEHDLTAAYGAHRATLQYATPLVDGGLTGRLAYPSLAFLVHVPMVLLGLSDRWVYLGFLVLTLGALFALAKPERRPLVLLPFLVEPRFIGYAFSGVSDGVWALFLVLAASFWDRRIARGVFLGLACAAKQHAWLVAPFLAVRAWSETEGEARDKARAVVELAGVATATFLIPNLPFMLWSPSAWWAGVMEPLSAPMITWGTGLSSLAAWGLLVVPRWVWSLGLYGGLAVGMFAVWRHPRTVGRLVWVLPGLALFMGHRSLTSYWYFGLLPFVAEWGRFGWPSTRSERSPWAAAGVFGAYAVALAAVLGSYAVQEPELGVRLGRPMWVEGHRVNQLLVGVRNDSDHPISPRFQVQTAAEQPLFWDRRAGPERLSPGEEATYVVGTRVPFEAFEMARGAVLFVGDAEGYWPRAAVHLRPDFDFAKPDRVPNPDFAYWADGGARPQFWTVDREGPSEARWGQRLGLELVLLPSDRAAVRVRTTILEPAERLAVRVRVPEHANLPPDLDERYGVQFRTADAAGLVLFGDQSGSGTLPDGRRWMMIEAPRGAWSVVELDVPGLLDALGLSRERERLPLSRFAQLDFPMRAVEMAVVFESEVSGGERTAYFGGFAQAEPGIPTSRYATEADVEAHARWLAELEVQAGNLDRASELLDHDEAALGLAKLALARAAAQTGSRVEALRLLRESRALPLDGEGLRVAAEVFAVLGALDEWPSFAVTVAERAQERGDAERADTLFLVMAEAFAEAGDCVGARGILARVQAVDAERGGALARCMDP
ncbi:MAG: hypothetical protein EP330_09535 [Deltaproteobacteria bacterium]|nr:MAG: hypothetical protein EP330_09535 [Deltaproteobacteria bacterium]